MKILIIGGYGNFGKRLALNLLENYQHDIIIAGRSNSKAESFKQNLPQHLSNRCSTVQLDIHSESLSQDILNQNIDITVNAVGPYQLSSDLGQANYPVAQACILSKTHYIDFADARDYVENFQLTFNKAAQESNLVFISGASTVPGLSCAVLDHFQAEFDQLEDIDYGISPGNRTERGEATVASILSYTGHTFNTLRDGELATVFGWQGLRRANFGKAIGKRWVSNCNIPDLDILPRRYPGLKNIRFQAGLELSILHLGLWLLSWLPRMGLVDNLAPYANKLTRMSEWFIKLGSDDGGMYVLMSGTKNKKVKTIRWHLVAEMGSGPNVPTIAAELAIDKIEKNALAYGARSCVGVFSLMSFLKIASRWGIYSTCRVAMT